MFHAKPVQNKTYLSIWTRKKIQKQKKTKKSKNQKKNAYTFTCTKKGEKHCRFDIPYWPINRSRVLMPPSRDDQRRTLLKDKVSTVGEKLETKAYDSFEAFLCVIDCDHNQYLNLIKSTLKRPTLIFERKMFQIYINIFHPWIASGTWICQLYPTLIHLRPTLSIMSTNAIEEWVTFT